jgi:hypothetical protein
MEIGDVRYKVYRDGSEPFISRMELIRISPKGVTAHFKPIDTLSQKPEKYVIRTEDLPTKTIDEAVVQFQEFVAGKATCWPNRRNDIDPKLAVLLILRAEALKSDLFTERNHPFFRATHNLLKG